jgi:hypothetical protein
MCRKGKTEGAWMQDLLPAPALYSWKIWYTSLTVESMVERFEDGRWDAHPVTVIDNLGGKHIHFP